jgi:hypothetical protein
MRVILLMILSLRIGVSCALVAPSVKGAVSRAQIVFRGRITDISDSEITFTVRRVWKGQVQARFSMPKVTWSGTPCLPGFYRGQVKQGAELLVYARRLPEFNVSGYVPTPGSRTAPVEYAAEDLLKLGRGHPPK